MNTFLSDKPEYNPAELSHPAKLLQKAGLNEGCVGGDKGRSLPGKCPPYHGGRSALVLTKQEPGPLERAEGCGSGDR